METVIELTWPYPCRQLPRSTNITTSQAKHCCSSNADILEPFDFCFNQEIRMNNSEKEFFLLLPYCSYGDFVIYYLLDPSSSALFVKSPRWICMKLSILLTLFASQYLIFTVLLR
ncbi:hypothetical protein OUZ56_025044 [Daphnia magna]|uniref:Uncharacterized protein n=1 Tax=Daphnia magna TaxID=35525 RepID=A0ABQ9ZIQ4_9CRUS|nr:hypothetical protein OUZ56_025044 [Daphnia magna]